MSMQEVVLFFATIASIFFAYFSIKSDIKILFHKVQQIEIYLAEAKNKDDVETGLTRRLNYIQQAKFAPYSARIQIKNHEDNK